MTSRPDRRRDISKLLKLFRRPRKTRALIAEGNDEMLYINKTKINHLLYLIQMKIYPHAGRDMLVKNLFIIVLIFLPAKLKSKIQYTIFTTVTTEL